MIQVAYASRTGHVKKVVEKLGLTNALRIVKGNEKLDGEYVIFIVWTVKSSCEQKGSSMSGKVVS